ncbi:uncharacterized protein ACA1_073720 [Acanthamoeba castellanii str. Neff]|uniref:DUF7869 domain-containing protein n=2 Tax=Acanthamoeba castellanii (strain ATCC 30010 / Neff) TaxID=1257118 RepID=L8HEY6_ACACF|nr:uncharacterized protein ACA1_073720 [Acanthamoeba castellanii str. Neff]ELR23725.1 hypothetical protein ACA1_073720 [Acanthamoeba castellanii str. Neff]
MSLIIDYSNPLPLPTHTPVPKAWMHFGNQFTMADNCAAENKNVFMLAFLSLLVSLDMFQEVYLSFLLVGHTHEDINQLFSTAQTKFHTSSIHTPR